MIEDWEEKKKIEDSLKVCREIQDYLRREQKEHKNDTHRNMNPGTRNEIERILNGENTSVSPEKESTDSKKEKEEEETLRQSQAPAKDMEPVKTVKATEPTASPEAVEEEYNERHPLLKTLLHTAICILAALALAILISRFVANHTSVEGSSMENTLANEDQLIVEKVSYYFHDPDRFDIVVFPHGDEKYIKRIIGLPGETVHIRDGYVYINGELLDEEYGREIIEDPGLASEEILLRDDEYFVLGDNRNASIDSRKAEVGVVRRSQIQGRAWLRIYPFGRVSFVE